MILESNHRPNQRKTTRFALQHTRKTGLRRFAVFAHIMWMCGSHISYAHTHTHLPIHLNSRCEFYAVCELHNYQSIMNREVFAKLYFHFIFFDLTHIPFDSLSVYLLHFILCGFQGLCVRCKYRPTAYGKNNFCFNGNDNFNCEVDRKMRRNIFARY